MKISVAITLGIGAIIAIAVITSLGNSSDQANQDKVRVAFFPSIGHAVPIVGIENGIFQRGLVTRLKSKLNFLIVGHK